MLLSAGEFNRAHNITGCLWLGDTRFFQIIEGPDSEIDDLFQKIKSDPRHTDLQTISDAQAEFRYFERWGMSLVREDEDETISKLIRDFTDRGVIATPGSGADDATEGVFDRLATRLVAFLASRPDPEARSRGLIPTSGKPS